MATYNVDEAIKAQKEFCEKRHQPNLTPSRGKCYRCNRNIYELWEREVQGWGGVKELVMSGVSVEKAGSDFVTGCPHCGYSFCN